MKKVKKILLIIGGSILSLHRGSRSNMNSYKKHLITLCLLFILPLSISCQRTTSPGELSYIPSGLALAPDGKRIAFRSVWEIEPYDTYTKIYVINIDGSEKVELINEPLAQRPQSGSFSWSPDSKRITFSLSRGVKAKKKSGIWIVDANGENRRPIIEGLPFKKAFDRDLPIVYRGKPKFRTGSNEIAFERDYLQTETLKQRKLTRGETELWVINLDGTNEEMLTSPVDKHNNKWEWSPDGREIFFIRKGNIWVINVDELQEKQLTTDLNIWYLDVSPNGKKILFLLETPNDGLWIMNIDGSQKKQLLSSKFMTTTQWSSGSKRIFFELRHPEAKEKVEIYSMNIDTKQQKKLAEIGSDFHSQIFLPDDKGIIAIRNKNTIWRMSIDGTNQHQIFPKP